MNVWQVIYVHKQMGIHTVLFFRSYMDFHDQTLHEPSTLNSRAFTLLLRLPCSSIGIFNFKWCKVHQCLREVQHKLVERVDTFILTLKI